MKKLLHIVTQLLLVLKILGKQAARCDQYIQLVNTSESDGELLLFQWLGIHNKSFYVFADSKHEIKIYNTSFKLLEGYPSGHTESITAIIQLGENSELFATTSIDRLVLVRNLTNNGSIVYSFSKHNAAVRSIAFIKCYNELVLKNMVLIATGDDLGNIFIWDALTGTVVDSLKETSRIISIWSMPKLNALGFTSGVYVKIYNLANNSFVKNLTFMNNSFTPDTTIYLEKWINDCDGLIIASSKANYFYAVYNISGEAFIKNLWLDLPPSGAAIKNENIYFFYKWPLNYFTYYNVLNDTEFPSFQLQVLLEGPILWSEYNKFLIALGSDGIQIFNFSINEPSILEGICYDECPDGSYKIDFELKCKPCHFQCETCFGNSSSQCKTCKNKNGSTFYNCCPENSNFTGHGPCICDKGFYFKNDGYCSSCWDFNCLNCDLSGKCLSCPNGYFLKENLCWDCPNRCNKCLNSSSCIECSYIGYEWDGKACVRKCSNTEYFLPYNDYCEKCNYPCSSCKGGGLNDCLSCSKEIFELSEGQCKLPNQSTIMILAFVFPSIALILLVLLLYLCLKRKRFCREKSDLGNKSDKARVENMDQISVAEILEIRQPLIQNT